MKIERIITAWSSAALMLINCLPQVKHEGIKMGIICLMTAFTMFVFGWSLFKRRKDDGNRGI